MVYRSDKYKNIKSKKKKKLFVHAPDDDSDYL